MRAIHPGLRHDQHYFVDIKFSKTTNSIMSFSLLLLLAEVDLPACLSRRDLVQGYMSTSQQRGTENVINHMKYVRP